MLILTRKKASYVDAARAYRVYIDGEKAGDIRNGETKEFPLTPGTHTLVLKIDWCSSRRITFEAEAGKDICAYCAPAKKPFLIGELLYITFKAHRYIHLELS